MRPGPPPLLRAVAGPVAVVGSVLVVLHPYVVGGLISKQNPDVLALWLPTYCLMGKSLAAGHILAWNPYVMGGMPFAADPQSGWMYAPAMLLFSLLSCGAAIRWFIVLQPIMAGLGVYWFARSEGLSRVAATVGGLALALPVAGSEVSLSLPFSASIAWTALVLAAASRLMRAQTWSSRLVWLVLTALGWGQLAAAHLSNGLVMGTLALACYLVARGWGDGRAGRPTGRVLASIGVMLAASLPLINLAYFLPRLAYLPRTSLGLGYQRLQVLSRAYSGMRAVGSLPGGTIRTTLPLRFVSSPGLYLGATALALTFAWWRSRHRAVAIGVVVFGTLCYVLSLGSVANSLAPHIRHWPLAGFYLREPARFSFGLPIAVAILAAIGLDAWRDAPSWRDRGLMAAPAVGVWICLPLAFGADRHGLLLFAVGIVAAGVVLVAGAFRPVLLVLVPVALAGELVANGLAGEASTARPPPDTTQTQQQLRPLYPILRPGVHVDDYLRPGPIARALERAHHGRYLSIDPGGWDTRGLHLHQRKRSWGLMATQRSMLFHIEEAQGYNATQEQRYWVFLRAVDPRRIKYNAAYLQHPVPLALNLLDVGWIVSPTVHPPRVPGARPAAHEGRWTLYRVGVPPRAQVASSWRSVGTLATALRAVLAPGFSPSADVVVERGPGARGSAPSGAATYRALSPQEARISVRSSRGGIVLIRTSYDPRWRATVDGRATRILPADYVLQAVPVPPGRHTIVLRYDDPTIGYGLLGSALALLVLLGAAVTLDIRRRTARRAVVAESDPRADPDRTVEAP